MGLHGCGPDVFIVMEQSNGFTRREEYHRPCRMYLETLEIGPVQILRM